MAQWTVTTMKITAFVIAAGLAATPLAQYAGEASASTYQAEAQIDDSTNVELPWYEQAAALEQAKQDQQPIVMVSNEVVQEIPEEPETTAIAATDREIECLISAVHYEARGEPREGQIAVVEVVLARRDSHRWPSTACGVIAQKSQFSFVRRGHIPSVPAAKEERYRDLVLDILNGEAKSSAQGATFFHATYVKPSWRHKLRKVSQIGRHLFYMS